MMNQTRIEWADMTWNPVTGCLYGCSYCYAEKQAKQYNPRYKEVKAAAHYVGIGKNGLYDISEPWSYGRRTLSHPFGFSPTFHRYRLEEPQLIKRPQNIFVCSMADLFGEWVPDEWIKEVFDHCYLAPQHLYLFLTKNSKRYCDVIEYLETKVKNYITPPAIFLGATASNNDQLWKAYESPATWISIEPVQEEIYNDCFVNFLPPDSSEVSRWLWVVIGAETGNRKGKIIPRYEWIAAIVEACKFWKIPVFMKNSLASIWGEPLIQEYPWEKG
jgi:protein gp37